MLGKKLGIDLGTAGVRVFVKGEGVILTEPTVVAILGTQAMAFGRAALSMAVTPGVQLVNPVREGEIADQDAVDELLRLVVGRVVGRQRIFKPDMVIAVTSQLPGEQRRRLLEAATRFGARTVYLLDAPMAAAMGSEIPLIGSQARLVIDAGAGRTEVCALAEEGTIARRCLRGGTRRLGDVIAAQISATHGVDAGSLDVDQQTISLAAAGDHDPRRLSVAVARAGRAVSLEVSSTEIQPLVDAYVTEVAVALRDLIAEIPVELEEGLRRDPALLCGGGARIEGMARALSAHVGLPVRAADDPQMAAVRGAGIAVDNLDMLKRNLMYIR